MNDLIQAILELGIVYLQLPTVLAGCRNGAIADDLTAIKQWGSIFLDPKALRNKVIKNLALHRKAIMQDLHDARTYWANGQYF